MAITSSTPLKVLDASAGSGKTFNLVKEYLILLLAEENSSRFAHIIAMTFTNKAAEEMKERVIRAIDLLSYPNLYGKASDDYASLLADEMKLSKETIQNRSKKLLTNILHQYEDLFILTIDKFNLRLIRSFTRDLDIPADFEIIINEDQLLEQIVDQLIFQVGNAGFESLSKRMLAFTNSKLEDGEKWDIRNELVKFSKILTSEKYFDIIDQMVITDFSEPIRQSLIQKQNKVKAEFELKTKEVLELYYSLNLDQKKVPGRSRLTDSIEKLNNHQLGESEVLFTPYILAFNNKELNDEQEYSDELRELINKTVAWFNEIIDEYRSNALIVKHFYSMSLLQYIALRLKETRNNEQIIRISEFNKLISSLVQNEDAPFIYERLGNRFSHFLLDEFQDTSHLQWVNMVPLIHESLSKQNKNLIVGDAKQSIYRFKNGLAEQFIALPYIYNPTGDSAMQRKSNYFFNAGIKIPLEDNWRSAKAIVNFNNELFTAIKPELKPEFQDYYASIRQNPKSIKQGYVEFIECEDQFEKIMIQWVEECLADGYLPADICFLGRTKKQLELYARILTEHQYQIVSSESLLIANNKAVQLTIRYLSLRMNPQSENELKRFAESYIRFLDHSDYTDYKQFLQEITTENGGKYTRFNDELFFKTYFTSKTTFFKKFENTYDLIQQFYKLLNIKEIENPYLHHLADIAHIFELRNGTDLQSFLNHYKQNKGKLSVQLPESEDAIKLMTIHKSKGLEFPIVIIPELKLASSSKNNAFYLLENDNNFYYSTTKNSCEIISKEADRMEAFDFIDGINLAYVAFTRPEARLYVGINDKKLKTLFIDKLAKLESPCIIAKRNENTNYTFGEREKKQMSNRIVDEKIFTPTSIQDKLWFPEIALQDKPSLNEPDSLSEARRYGNQFHDILAHYCLPFPLEETLSKLLEEGLIEQQFIAQLKTDLKELMHNEEFNALFKDVQQVHTEQDLITEGGEIKRPDLILVKKSETIVLDYKTGFPKSKDNQQVLIYKQLLEEIGYSNVKCYLFYTGIKEIKQIA
jgi:ATP-dependent exoDNAse (exonuclease V) beta subunit